MRAEFIVFLLFLAIFLYAKTGGKIAIPGIGSAVGTLRSILFREQLVTTALLALFLLTFSYAFGNSWKSVFGWWKSSQMALPLLLATIGIILFANCEWRKTVNNGLMFLVGALIATTFMVNAFMGWWTGGDEKETPVATASAQTASAPTQIAQATQATPTPPSSPPTPKLTEKEETIVANYGVFTPVEFPPMKELVKFRWENAPEGCVVAVVSDDVPEGAKFPCDSTIKKIGAIKKIGFASDIPGAILRIPIRYAYRPQV